MSFFSRTEPEFLFFTIGTKGPADTRHSATTGHFERKQVDGGWSEVALSEHEWNHLRQAPDQADAPVAATIT